MMVIILPPDSFQLIIYYGYLTFTIFYRQEIKQFQNSKMFEILNPSELHKVQQKE